MRNPIRTHRFSKDVKRARKRGKNLAKLRVVMERLITEEPLESRPRDHPLVGGKVDLFSIDSLANMLTHAGLRVAFSVGRASA